MRLSRRDVYFISLKLTLIFSILYYFGLLLGLSICFLYSFLSDSLMYYLFGMEAVSPVDTLIVHDDENNVANVVCKIKLTFIRYRCYCYGKI